MKKKKRSLKHKAPAKKHHVLGELHPNHITEPHVVVAVPKSTWDRFLDWFQS